MARPVFVIDRANQLTELRPTAYDSEDLFQQLLAQHPAILGTACAGDGRLLLVRREAPVPEAEGGSGRWSLDHLFLDREGVPVLVEVKRATDTRARREVVAQMLDYAANGVAYWPVEQIIGAYQATQAAANGDADAHLAEFLDGSEPELFWRQVESNLRSGRVRMVFVADQIAKELRRIVEFLNEQMRPAEVLAIEVEQYATSDGLRVLAPRLLGATERAITNKSVQTAKPPIAEEDWMVELGQAKGAVAAANAQMALAWFRSRDFNVSMSNSQDSIALSLTRPDGKNSWPFFIRRSSGKLEIALQYLQSDPPYAPDVERQGLLDRLKALPGVAITTTKITGLPAVPLDQLSRPEVWTPITEMAEEIKRRVTTS